MKRILKTRLEMKEFQYVDLPIKSNILSVQEQNGDLYVWFVSGGVDIPTKVRIFGTGQLIDEDVFERCSHISTVLMSNGFVWHVFTEY